MRQVLVICALAALVSGCGDQRDDAARSGFYDAIAACGRANKPLVASLQRSFSSRAITDNHMLSLNFRKETQGDFIAMRDACQPILSGMYAQSPDPQLARTASICQNAVKMVSEGISDIYNDYITDNTIETEATSLQKTGECRGHIEEMVYQSTSPDRSIPF